MTRGREQLERVRLDWRVLDRLRDTFLEGEPLRTPYWRSRHDLEQYDATFGTRIGWKWDAVLRELCASGWTPPGGILLDWGCGSGVAGRRVAVAFGANRVTALRLFDRSPLAAGFAADAAHTTLPGLDVALADAELLEGSRPIAVLVASHVLTELPPEERASLLRLARRAAASLWLEPGTPAASRALIAVREELRRELDAVAPCTHRQACGMLAPGNESHWCHFFAAPPQEASTDSGWARFARRAGIDLRRLPYSFLVLERREERERGTDVERRGGAAGHASTAHEPDRHRPDSDAARVIGAPRCSKGGARVLSCEADGVRERPFRARDDPALFRTLRDGRELAPHHWELAGARIVSGRTLHR